MRRLLLSLALLLIILAALAAFGFKPFVARVAQPWVLAKAAAALSAEVRLERLELDWGRCELHGLRIERPGELRLTIEQIAVDYTLAGLWQHRLAAVEIRQPELQWQGTAKSGGEASPWPQQPPLQVDAWTVSDGHLQLTFGKEQVLLHRLEASGSLGPRFRIEAATLLGKPPGVPLVMTGDGRWEGTPQLTLTRLLWAGHPLLQAPVTVAPGASSLEATLALEQLNAVETARWLATLDQPVPWPATLAWQVSAPRLTVGFADQRLALRLETAAGEVRQGERRWPWESLSLQLAHQTDSWQIDGTVTLPAQTRAQLTATWREQRLRGHWQLALPSPTGLGQALGFKLPTAAAGLRDIALSGDLSAAASDIAAENIQLAARWRTASELSATLSGRWQAGAVDIEASDLTLREGPRALATAAFRLSGRSTGNSWKGRWQLQAPEGLRLASALVDSVTTGGPDLQEVTLQGELEHTGNGLAIPNIRLGGRLAGAGLSGKVAGQLAVQQRASGWRCDLAQLAVTAIEYASPDGSAGVTNGGVQLAGTLDWQQELGFALRGEVTAGEALAGSWYADLGGLPLHLATAGRWIPATRQLQLHTGQLDLAGLVTADLHGELAPDRWAGDGKIVIPRLDGTLQTRLGQLVPELERLTLGGRLTADLSGGWRPEGWELLAALHPDDLALGWGDTFRLKGLNGELPLLLQRGSSPPMANRQTMLRWEELRLGPLTSTAGRMPLTAGANRWLFEEPLHLAVGGGELELAGTGLELPAAGPQLNTSVKATSIDLAQLSRTLGGPEMGGQLNAELPGIRLTRDEVRIGGEALLKVFAGELKVRNMRVDKPLSRYPGYYADLDFAGIDLQQLTQTFAFGEVNGIADGYVHDLRLFGTVPSAFRATFATREEGPRNISVKAIRNLNTLSQGGLSAVLSQGIYRFIDFYRYRKIGIRCHLQNDLFRLEGTARPGTSTYLIDGGLLPPRLDVIVSSPTISFQEMVRRLKRVERTGH